MIWAVKVSRDRSNSSANTKIIFRNYEISIAMDDSCGALKELSRTEIRVYKGNYDVTSQFHSTDLYSSEGLFSLMSEIAQREVK